MAKFPFTRNGWLFGQDAEFPPHFPKSKRYFKQGQFLPSQAETAFWSERMLPVVVSQAATGWFTLPLFGQEQDGLQQSQYPVVLTNVGQYTKNILILTKSQLSKFVQLTIKSLFFPVESWISLKFGDWNVTNLLPHKVSWRHQMLLAQNVKKRKFYGQC